MASACQNRFVLALALVFPPANAAAQSDAPASWSGSAEAYIYLMQDDDFAVPIASADRGELHLEGRYQYEDFRTFSVWAGWRFEAGTSLHLDVVPMAGVLAGRTRGFAPGLEATLSWKSLELYSESEYVFDTAGTESDYYYHWSQLGWQAKSWLTLGLSVQRTRLYQSELSFDRAIYAAATIDVAKLSVYGFNLDGEAPFVIIAMGVDF